MEEPGWLWRLGPAGARAIAEALKVNRTLRQLVVEIESAEVVSEFPQSASSCQKHLSPGQLAGEASPP